MCVCGVAYVDHSLTHVYNVLYCNTPHSITYSTLNAWYACGIRFRYIYSKYSIEIIKQT